MNQLKPIKKIYAHLAAGAAILFLLLAARDNVRALPRALPVTLFNQRSVAVKSDQFKNLNLEARAVMVYDVNSGRMLYAKNEREILPIASLTKLMTVLAARRELTPAAVVSFASHDWLPQAVFDYALVTSSNAAAAAIAREVEAETGESLVSRMNALALELGLTETSFNNPTGLDELDGEPTSLSSASDIAELLAYILKTDRALIAATAWPDLQVAALDGVRFSLHNTNILAGEIPGLLASKTGYTRGAEGSLAVIFDRGLNEPTVVVVLGSSEDGRFADMRSLVNATLEL